jgi:hypothetical protein
MPEMDVSALAFEPVPMITDAHDLILRLTHQGSTNVRAAGPLSLLNLFSIVSVMTSGHVCVCVGGCR